MLCTFLWPVVLINSAVAEGIDNDDCSLLSQSVSPHSYAYPAILQEVTRENEMLVISR